MSLLIAKSFRLGLFFINAKRLVWPKDSSHQQAILRRKAVTVASFAMYMSMGRIAVWIFLWFISPQSSNLFLYFWWQLTTHLTQYFVTVSLTIWPFCLIFNIYNIWDAISTEQISDNFESWSVLFWTLFHSIHGNESVNLEYINGSSIGIQPCKSYILLYIIPRNCRLLSYTLRVVYRSDSYIVKWCPRKL